MDVLDFYVSGEPIPQGSLKAVPRRGIRGGPPVLVGDNPRLPAWRAKVTAAAMAALRERGAPVPAGAAAVSLTFYLPRPSGHFGTGRNRGLIKDSAPVEMRVKPDLDKLIRAVFDGLTAGGVWADDSRVNSVSAFKCYADGKPAGAAVSVMWQGADE